MSGSQKNNKHNNGEGSFVNIIVVLLMKVEVKFAEIFSR